MTIRLSVPDMSCGHCKASVEAALGAAGAKAVAVDLAQKTVSAEGSPGPMIAALAEVGFPARLLTEG